MKMTFLMVVLDDDGFIRCVAQCSPGQKCAEFPFMRPFRCQYDGPQNMVALSEFETETGR